MKRLAISILLLVIIISYSSNLFAKKYDFVFWYPGEQGSTAEAEPVLASFFDYLNKKLNGNKFSGKYFNSTSKGLIYIKSKKPQFGIASWIAMKENNGTLPAFGKIASTLPFPHGGTSEQFSIVGRSKEENGEWSQPDNLVIFSSIPISVVFLKSYLLPDFQGNVSIQTTNTMLMTLKKISSSENPNQVALLTPIEKYTLDNLESEWTKSLKTLAKSKSISTAPFIYFGEKPEISEDLVKVLVKMPNDPEGKEILETLRLKGFKPEN